MGKTLKVLKTREDAILPKYATDGSACFDLHTVSENTILNYTGTVLLNTGLKFEVPDGWVMLIFSRSGHGFKNDIRLANCTGIIDSDYRGEVMVKLTMDNKDKNPPYQIRKGDRIAQAMLVQVEQWHLVEVQELSNTVRGEGGFGSTGTKRNFFGQIKKGQ